jgi:putative membrane protein
MNPNPPWGGPEGGGPMFVQHESWWMGLEHLLPIVLFAVLVGVVVWGVLRLTSHEAPRMLTAGAPAAPPRDHALEELRVRYARGEVDRTEYLERSADLGGPQLRDPAADQTSTGEPPADQAEDQE